jgi:putative transposase
MAKKASSEEQISRALHQAESGDVKPRQRRELGQWLRAVFAASSRRLSGLMMINRATMNHQSRRDPQTALKIRLRELAASRVRFGYRRLTVMLRREVGR